MDQRTRRNDMTDWWGWVDVYKDGAVDVGEYGEQLSGNGLEITSHDPPEDVKRIMAMLDLMGPNGRLEGGSSTEGRENCMIYYIHTADLKNNQEKT